MTTLTNPDETTFVYNELIQSIEYWNNLIDQSQNKQIYEIAFFKIYIKFERFLSKMFIHYCIGNCSQQYIPDRQLEFYDENHLIKFIKNGSSYVDYIKVIRNLSNYIFKCNKNPFKKFLEDSNNVSEFNRMQALRNYIAHESEESKKKYLTQCLKNKQFIEPFEYLSSYRKKNHHTNYSIFINTIKDTAAFIYNPFFN